MENIKPIYQTEDFTLYQNDCNLIFPLYKNSIDLIFADPPYFLSNDGQTILSGKIQSVNKGIWDKGKDIEEINKFNYDWISKAKESLKDTGTILISGTYHNIFSIGINLQLLGFKILNIITWEKPNPPPNFSCRYLTHSTEQIIWAKKNMNSKYIFNYDILKQLNNNKQLKDVWRFTPVSIKEKEYGRHPTQKPLNLLLRLITMASLKDSIIFDPFNGSGTTGIAANLLKRRYIGCEIEKEYINLTIKRKENIK